MGTELEYAIIIHEAEEGGFWSDVPSLPGAGSQGETVDETVANTKESIEAVLDVMRESGQTPAAPHDLIIKISVAA